MRVDLITLSLSWAVHIPKKIADKLRIGEKNIETCQVGVCRALIESNNLIPLNE